MGTYRSELIGALERATLLVHRLVSKEITIDRFLKEYDNFFYYEALDGHEAYDNRELVLAEFSMVISLHEKIQTSIVDLVYIGREISKQEYLDAGRITPEVAEHQIQSLANEYDIPNLLKSLEKKRENP